MNLKSIVIAITAQHSVQWTVGIAQRSCAWAGRCSLEAYSPDLRHFHAFFPGPNRRDRLASSFSCSQKESTSAPAPVTPAVERLARKQNISRNKELTMIFMIGGTIVGIILGMLVVRFVPQNVLGWVVIGLGAVALVFIIPGLVAVPISGDTMFSPAFSIPLGVGCVVSGIGAVRKNYRTWQVWLGLGLGIIPILFWIAFAIGEILYPH